MVAEKGTGKGKNVKKGTKGFVTVPKKPAKAPSAAKGISTKAKDAAIKVVKDGSSSPSVNLYQVARLVASYTDADFAKHEKSIVRLEDLAINGNSEVRLAVASNPNTSESTLENLLDSDKIDYKILRAIFDREDLSLELQRKVVYNKLMKKDEYDVAYILTRKKLDIALIGELADEAMKNTISTNSKEHYSVVRGSQVVPGDLGFVARNLAMNPNTPYGVLTRLASSPNWAVRYNVALHHNTLLDYVDALVSDSDPAVARVAKQASKTRRGKRDWNMVTHYPTGWGALPGVKNGMSE